MASFTTRDLDPAHDRRLPVAGTHADDYSDFCGSWSAADLAEFEAATLSTLQASGAVTCRPFQLPSGPHSVYPCLL